MRVGANFSKTKKEKILALLEVSKQEPLLWQEEPRKAGVSISSR